GERARDVRLDAVVRRLAQDIAQRMLVERIRRQTERVLHRVVVGSAYLAGIDVEDELGQAVGQQPERAVAVGRGKVRGFRSAGQRRWIRIRPLRPPPARHDFPHVRCVRQYVVEGNSDPWTELHASSELRRAISPTALAGLAVGFPYARVVRSVAETSPVLE